MRAAAIRKNTNYRIVIGGIFLFMSWSDQKLYIEVKFYISNISIVVFHSHYVNPIGYFEPIPCKFEITKMYCIVGIHAIKVFS